MCYDLGKPSIILSKPILISKQSNADLISNFLKDRINSASQLYFLEDT